MRCTQVTQIVYETGDFNFAEAINLGRTAATGDYLLLLNDDTTVALRDPVTRMLEIGQIPGVGVTGCLLTYPDGRLQHVGMVILPSGPTHAWIGKSGKEYGYFGSILTPRNYSAVTAAAMLVRTSVFDELDGFDTAFAKDFNDVDFCLKVRAAGFNNLWTPYAELYHHESASRGKEDTLEKRDRFRSEVEYMRATWGDLLDRDPAYNSNLTHTINDFTLALPPREWPPLK